MKKTVMLLLSVLFLFSLTGCKAEEEIVNVPTPKIEQQTILLEREKNGEEHFIEVVGNGEILATPDFATLTMRVSMAGETAEAASAACQEAEQELIRTAGTLQIRKKEITQRGIEIEQQISDDGKVTLYHATDLLTIVILDVAKTETFLATLIDSGTCEVQGVTYSITEASEAYRDALTAAIGDAYAKARALAETTEVHLGEVIGIQEASYDETKLIGVAFESSAIAVDAQVTVRYKID